MTLHSIFYLLFLLRNKSFSDLSQVIIPLWFVLWDPFEVTEVFTFPPIMNSSVHQLFVLFSEQSQAEGKLPCQSVNLVSGLLTKTLVLHLKVRPCLRKAHRLLGPTCMDIFSLIPPTPLFDHHHINITSPALLFAMYAISHFYWRQIMFPFLLPFVVVVVAFE